MKINEIERLSGMNRANIRFYEKEGLIKPRRLENNYRDYTQADLAVLQRVKLLRSLHIPLSDIKALESSSKSLGQVLASQLARLEQERDDLDSASAICRAMQKDQVSYAGLDAGKYLAVISAQAQAAGSSYFSLAEAEDLVEQTSSPWPRFWARMLDILLCRVLWSSILVFVFTVNLSKRTAWAILFDSYMALGLLLILDPVWLSLFASTPGKLILGLQIRKSSGGLMSYREARQRTWHLLGAGLGYNLPIYGLIRLWKSYRLARELKAQPWDEDLICSIKDEKCYRKLAYGAALAAVLFLSVLLLASQLLPPNRGDLTIAQFVENHNYYARYFGLDFGDFYLAESGDWQEKAFAGTVYLDITSTARPDYRYGLADGFVTDVSFIIELENEDAWLSSYDNHKMLVSLALAGAQKDVRLFSKLPSRLASQISANSFQDYSYSTDSFQIASSVDHTGYFNTDLGFLVPQENAAKQYFKLDFIAAKKSD